jgi:hypothetical protein
MGLPIYGEDTVSDRPKRGGDMFRKIPWKDVCKFLAGAFFVSAGVLLYLYAAGVSVPVLGVGFTVTPEINGVRSIVHFILFLAFFYLGFIRK